MSASRIYAPQWENYELIDAGGGKKLERWGKIITIRPEVQAYFRSELPFNEWKKCAHWEFIESGAQKGKWNPLKPDAIEQWNISYEDLKFNLHLTQFKHIGLFPEQSANWELISSFLEQGDRFLNLFAYTGAASCVARFCGAEVLHVDSVKQLITWAAENMQSSNLKDIRWVHEDALKFTQRASRRAEKYNLVLMDPPAWGIGKKNELWKLEDKLETLIKDVSGILDEKSLLILNTYSPKVDLNMLRSLADQHLKGRRNELVELWMKTTTGKELFYGNLLRSFS